MATLKLYVSSISSNATIKKSQSRIQDILTGLKVEFEIIDVAADNGKLATMREIVGDEKAIPPQLCRGSEYLGNYESFEEAVEDKNLDAFLKL